MGSAAPRGRRESAYLRLARALREAIQRDEFADGVRLPTETELAREHGLSRQTVRRAFQDLVAEGLVYRVPGRGTFVAEHHRERYLRQFGTIDDLMGLSLDTTMEVVAPLRSRVEVTAASRLRLTADLVDTLVFLRRHEETPFCLTTVHLPPGVGELLQKVPEVTEPERRSSVTIIGLLEERLAHPITDAEQSITVDGATAEVAEHLGCPRNQPLLRVDRLYYSSTGEPVELAVSYFLPEHYSYRVNLRRSLP